MPVIMFDGVRSSPSLVVTPDLKHPPFFHSWVNPRTARGDDKVPDQR
jgi:hypothetical protein